MDKARPLVVTMWAESNKQRLCFSWRFDLSPFSIIFTQSSSFGTSADVNHHPFFHRSTFQPITSFPVPSRVSKEVRGRLHRWTCVYQTRPCICGNSTGKKQLWLSLVLWLRHWISGNHWLIMHDWHLFYPKLQSWFGQIRVKDNSWQPQECKLLLRKFRQPKVHFSQREAQGSTALLWWWMFEGS